MVCWLMLAGLAHDARSAFEFFASKRSKITKGVTQASQKRYVAYFTDICRKQKAPTVRLSRSITCHSNLTSQSNSQNASSCNASKSLQCRNLARNVQGTCCKNLHSSLPSPSFHRCSCKPRVEVCSTRSYPESMLWNNPFVRYHDHTEGKIVMDVGIKIMGDTVCNEGRATQET